MNEQMRRNGSSGEYIKGRPQGISCLVEEVVKVSGMFKLVHDGSESGSRYYTKTYQMVLDGQPLKTWVRFRYDLRDNWADVRISRKNIADLERFWEQHNKEDKESCTPSEQPSDSIVW